MKKKLLIVGIITTLLIAGCSQSSNSTNSATPDKDEDTQTQASTSTPTETNTPPSSGNMQIQPQTPTTLTEEQQKQLDAGKAAHSPTTLTFNVTGRSFYFTPNEIHVKKGDTVKIVFNNAGGFHNFLLDEFNVKMNPINGGETATAEFVADKVGTFEYYCGVGKHRQMGQKGNLVVEE